MNAQLRRKGVGVAFALITVCTAIQAEDNVLLQLEPSGEQVVVGLHGKFKLPVAGMYPEYTIQRSPDLKTWTTVAGPIAGTVGVSDEVLRIPLPVAGDQAFYRVLANVEMDSEVDAAEAVFGYGTEFSLQLQQLGQLPLEDFVARYAVTNEYLPQITFDPTTAEYWDQWNIDPAIHNATNRDTRLRDFRLSPEELGVFHTNGFVVSQRLERESFADVFYDIYTDDLPVFISTDAILHAWHRTFETILEEVEEIVLTSMLDDILDGIAAGIPALHSQTAGTAMEEGVLDADFFLAVARSLLSGTRQDGSLGQSERVDAMLSSINRQVLAEVDFYGSPRVTDFSQFRPRGHYTKSETLERYFQAMMWCARADFRFAGDAHGESAQHSANSLRELSGALALHFLLQNSDQFTNWLKFDKTIEMFVGQSDSMNFAQLDALLDEVDMNSPASFHDRAALTNLQTQLMTGTLGLQDIGSDFYLSPFGPEQVKLPRSFTVMGQRFVLDSWVLSQCVFDRILWDDPTVRNWNGKVLRRVPSGLDVAFAALGNDQIVREIAARIASEGLVYEDGRIFWRDGMPYQHNLAAARNVVDLQNESAWTGSVYAHWLACLRELSEPTTTSSCPEAMRTRAWAMKTLNTQLASWTQMRHDTVLYAKQSHTHSILCSYPAGFVEPRPAFWGRMRQMALATKEIMADLPTGSFHHEFWRHDWLLAEITGATRHADRLAVMDRFAQTTETLKTISEKELLRQPLSAEETEFLERVVGGIYVGLRLYDGWYPALFYQPIDELMAEYDAMVNSEWVSGDGKGSDYWDALVTDVHTDVPAPIVGDPGSILHEAVGNVQLLMIAVDCGPDDLAVYGGPVLSHYEFEMGHDERMPDEEWKQRVKAGDLPPPPEWTRSYLVPNTDP